MHGNLLYVCLQGRQPPQRLLLVLGVGKSQVVSALTVSSASLEQPVFCVQQRAMHMGVHQTHRLSYTFLINNFYSTLLRWIYFIIAILILLGREGKSPPDVNVKHLLSQIKWRISRYRPADFTRTVDGLPILQYSYVLSTHVDVCHYNRKQKRANSALLTLCQTRQQHSKKSGPAWLYSTGRQCACYHPFLLLSSTCIRAHTLLNYWP